MTVSGQDEPDGKEEALYWQRCLAASDAYIATLDKLSSEFVRLRFREALPQEEVAHRLSLTRSKVRTLEKRIRSELKRHLRSLHLL